MESKWPLYMSLSNIEQERMNDLEDAKNLGDLEIKYPGQMENRKFMGVAIADVEGSITEGR